jgi:hypothetical protein
MKGIKMTDENLKNPVLNLFLGATALTSIFSIAKFFGFLSVSWLAVFSPLLLFCGLFLIIGVIYTSCIAAFSQIREKIKEDLREALEENTEVTIVTMGEVISSEKIEAK